MLLNMKEREDKDEGGKTKEIEFNNGIIDVGKQHQPKKKLQILPTYLQIIKKVFAFDKNEIGKCNMAEFSFQLTDKRPIHMVSYRYSLLQRQEIQKQVAELLELGIIAHS